MCEYLIQFHAFLFKVRYRVLDRKVLNVLDFYHMRFLNSTNLLLCESFDRTYVFKVPGCKPQCILDQIDMILVIL